MKLLVIAAALVISTSALAKNGGGGGGGGSGHSGPGMSMSHPGSGPGSGMNPLASVEGICAVEDGDISIVDGGGITELDPAGDRLLVDISGFVDERDVRRTISIE